MIGKLETIDFFRQLTQYPFKVGTPAYKHYQTLTKNVSIIMASAKYPQVVYAIKISDLENKLMSKEKELANYIKQQNYYRTIKKDFEKLVSAAK